MRLLDIRNQQGLNTLQMAARLGITQGHYCHLENGSRRLTNNIASKIEAEFGINKEELENDFVVSNPYLGVINNWIWNIRINDLPVTQAFINDIGFLKIQNINEHDKVLEAFIRYILFSIGRSIEIEFAKDPKMMEYLVSRLNK
jgi:transcriptional regulator with XRE-family HTH domain